MQLSALEAEDNYQTMKTMLLIMRCKLQKQDSAMCLFSQNATRPVAESDK